MEGVLVRERSIEGCEKLFIIQLSNSETNTEDEDSYSAAFILDDLLYLLVDCLEVVDDL